MVSTITYAEVLRPNSKRLALIYDALLVIVASLAIAMAAQVTLRLPFSPVPITGQTFAVLLVGILLGSRRGTAAVLAYLTQGALGLPVFAGGATGLLYMFGPTAGYLMGFVAAAYLVGRLAERGWDRHTASTLAAMCLGNLAIYAGGVLWLSVLLGPAPALSLGLYPFILGDLAKAVLAAILLPGGWRLLASLHSRGD